MDIVIQLQHLKFEKISLQYINNVMHEALVLFDELILEHGRVMVNMVERMLRVVLCH